MLVHRLQPPTTSKRYSTFKIEHTHVVGKDPCPQNVSTKINIYCLGLGNASAAGCTVDSFEIIDAPGSESTSIGLSGAAGTNGNLTLNKDGAVSFDFTCSIAQSFVHKYEVILYYDGKEVTRETVEVVVTVVQ